MFINEIDNSTSKHVFSSGDEDDESGSSSEEEEEEMEQEMTDAELEAETIGTLFYRR